MYEKIFGCVDQGRDEMSSLVTQWVDAAVLAEDGGNERVQQLTKRGADLALFRMLQYEAMISIFLSDPLPHLRTLFNIADVSELEYERDAELAKGARDSVFAMMDAVKTKDSEKITAVFHELAASLKQFDAELMTVALELGFINKEGGCKL